MSTTRKQIEATIALLCERFPKCFVMFERRRVPLKVGIRDDIIAILGDQIDRQLLNAAMQYYCNNFHYRRSQKPGALRFDLDGNPCGEVSEEHAAGAAKDIAARKIAQAKKKQEAFRPKPDANTRITIEPETAASRTTLDPEPEALPRITIEPEPDPETAASPPTPPKQRDGLARLRAAAQRRKAMA
jgi:ProP effector